MRFSTLLTVALAGLAFAAPIAQAANVGFTFRGPAAHMNDSDWETFRAEAREVLENGEDNRTYQWTNSETGVSGTFTRNRSFEENGAPCRDITVTLAAGPSQGSQVMMVCKQTDDTWRIVR